MEENKEILKDVVLFASEKMILTDMLDAHNLRTQLGNPEVVWMQAQDGILVDGKTCELSTFKVGEDNEAKFSANGTTYPINDESNAKAPKIIAINTLPDDHYMSLMEYNLDEISGLRRCTKCILPETFPSSETLLSHHL